MALHPPVVQPPVTTVSLRCCMVQSQSLAGLHGGTRSERPSGIIRSLGHLFFCAVDYSMFTRAQGLDCGQRQVYCGTGVSLYRGLPDSCDRLMEEWAAALLCAIRIIPVDCRVPGDEPLSPLTGSGPEWGRVGRARKADYCQANTVRELLFGSAQCRVSSSPVNGFASINGTKATPSTLRLWMSPCVSLLTSISSW